MTAPDLYFLVGTYNATSPDLATWTAQPTVPTGGQVILWAEDLQLWVLGTTNGIWISQTGVVWDQALVDATASVDDIVWTGSRLIAVGTFNSGAAFVATSSTGGGWSTVATGFEGGSEDQLISIDGHDDVWVATGHATTLLIHTTDGGDTWAASSFTDGSSLAVADHPVVYGPGGWIVAGKAFGPSVPSIEAFIAHSADGASWASSDLYTPFGVTGINSGGLFEGGYRIGGNDNRIYSSTDGVTWSLASSGAPGFAPIRLRELNSHLIGFASGDVYSSTDGATFSDVFSVPGDGPASIGYGQFGLLPPQRQYPRDDGLGISQRRFWPPSESRQAGLRRGMVNTYQ